MLFRTNKPEKPFQTMTLQISLVKPIRIDLSQFKPIFIRYLTVRTHGSRSLTTLLVKYFNDLLDGHSSERSRNKVTFFYVGGVLCIHLGSKYADFQEKNHRGDFWEKVPNFS